MDRGLKIGEELSILILLVPYIFVTRIVLAQRISSFLDLLANLAPKNEATRNIPIEFNQCSEKWRTKEGWNTEAFSSAFSACFEKSQHAESSFKKLIFLMHRYDFVSLVLDILTRPHLLHLCFDTSRMHRRELTDAAHEGDLQKLKWSVEVGEHITNDERLANLAKNCFGVADFLAEGIRLAEIIYPGRINGFPFKDVGGHIAADVDKCSNNDKDVFDGCEIRFTTGRPPLEDYMPQDLKGLPHKRSGGPGDGGDPFRPTKVRRTY